MEKVLWITEYSESKTFFNSLSDKQENIEIMIIDELNIGFFDKELILGIRTRCPKIRIIYIGEHIDSKKKHFLYLWNVYDILLSDERDKIKDVINNPTILHDIGITIEEDTDRN